MSFFLRSRRFVSTAIAVAVIATGTVGQTPQDPDVIRISTDLVQTGVVVLDKQGKFVPGLKADQFVFKVEGKPITPTFFEQVTSGSEREQKLERTVGRGEIPAASTGATSYRGRTIIFFIDDLHLSKESVESTRKSMYDFIDKQMSIDDLVAVASPTGQIGFLQKFTDIKPVVRAAVNRISYRPYTVRDHESVPMSEYQALRIQQGDRDATDHYVSELMKMHSFKLPAGAGGLGPPAGGPTNVPQQRSAQPGMTREAATRIVQERAGFMMRQSESVTSATLTTLESLMRSSMELPGRKLVFFISDGFFLNDRSTSFGEKLRRITDAAVRAGGVVYSLDARGMSATIDASSNRQDAMGRLSRSNIGELAASQDALNALAADTGGKAFFNTGRLTEAVNSALDETSNYYLLAWRPTTEDQKAPGFKRVEVSVVGRPDLTVRLPKGFLMGDPKPAEKSTNESATPTPVAAKGADQTLMKALHNPIGHTALPTSLSVGFIDVPNSGTVLTIDTQMATDVLGYGPDGKQPASVKIGGVVLDENGKQAGAFQNRLTVNPNTNTAVQNPGVIYSHKVPLKPGIYQIRVAASDEKSGRLGSATRWIEIPDLASKKLTLSSMMLGGQFYGADQKSTTGEQLQFSVDRRFPKGANLNFLMFIYNASASPAPDLEAQIRIVRNGKPVVSSPVLKVPVDAATDLARISYGANVGLRNLTPGRYLLEVAITDKLAKTTATQQAGFDIQ